MHEYLFQSSLRAGSSLKRLAALSRREVLFEPQKKKKKNRRSDKAKVSQTRLSLVLILTSRPSTSNETEGHKKSSFQPVSQISAAQFYEKPKSHLEKRYEKNLQKFVPIVTSDDFSPLELDSTEIEQTAINCRDDLQKIYPQLEPAVSQMNVVSDERQVDVLDFHIGSEKEDEFHVTYFINASDEFMKKAHSIVLTSNDLKGTKIYYSFIKLAIKALQIVILEYGSCLNPIIELVTYHKLGMIYLKETQALDKAEHYVTSAISLASKHNLTKLKAVNEFLYCEILEQTNPQGLSPYLKEKQSLYENEGNVNIASLYFLMRSNHIRFLNDAFVGTKSVHSMGLKSETHPAVKFLSLIHEANTSLYHGAIASARTSIEDALKLDFTESLPPQMTALKYLMMLACCVHDADIISGEALVIMMNEFLCLQRNSGWAGWRDDGLFYLYVPLLEMDSGCSTFEVQWLDSDEFIILFHFLRGLLDLSTYSDREQTKKVFSTCLEITNIQISQLTSIEAKRRNFRISYLTDKIVRLNFFRYSIIFYKVWIEFMHENNFDGIALIQSFIDCFDGESFTKEEMCFYELLVPKFLYLAAIYYQSNGDLNPAKLYFFRIRKTFDENGKTFEAMKCSLRRKLGIGCELMLPKLYSSDLYLYLTLHLVLIAQHDLQVLSQMKSTFPEAKSKIIACHSLLGDLLSKLNGAFSKTLNGYENPDSKNASLFVLSFRILMIAYDKNNGKGKDVHLKDELTLIASQMVKFQDINFVKTLTSYLLYKLSTSLKESGEMFQEFISDIANGNANARSLAVLAHFDDEVDTIPPVSKSFAEVQRLVQLSRKSLDKKLHFARLSVEL